MPDTNTNSPPSPPSPSHPTPGPPKVASPLAAAPQLPQPPNALPGDGFFGWLGRQIGHIRQAVHTDVTQPQLPPPTPAPPDSKTVWRDSRMEEQPSPDDPNVKLRRTIIDEVIVSTETPKIDKAQPPKA